MIRTYARPCTTCGAITVEASCLLCALDAAVTPEQRAQVWRDVEAQRDAIAHAQAVANHVAARNLEVSPW